MSRRHRAGCVRGERGRELRRRLAARDGARCLYCALPFPRPEDATLDHFVPYSLWRTNRPANLVLACVPCNNAKGATLPYTLVVLLLAGSRRAGWGWTA
ncbi:HNH endonuclease [Streptomyces iconiensis]|uniref:HNH endonuclease signature motif containing protein n=1 Tax=Streptomyces iconiensis TaxID=1384038 RepID=A0ABT6ZRT5_9ACTN|nr:HNH endonuclease signature motif containing protein [Streptomyces iconiensis]MDJ1131782.1 HNH endonuclease signature motif containing protein [Streptomyces iconiensis]